MAQFEVTERGGWFEAECRELGVLITGKKLADVEETARRTAARVKMEAAFSYKTAPENFFHSLSRWLGLGGARSR